MSKIGKFIRREPLVHFAVLAALLFVVNAFWSGDAREEIRIDRATSDYLIEQQAELLSRDLTPEEQRETVDRFVEDELLFREGRKRGLDDNSRIRRLVVQNMRYFLTGDPVQPSNDELRSYFKQNLDRFASSQALTLTHVYFAKDDEIPDTILDRLRAGEDLTDLRESTSIVVSRIAAADEDKLASVFGPAQAKDLIATAGESWVGPIVTRFGTHFVKVEQRHAPRIPTFEDAGPWIEAEWARAQHIAALDRAIDEFRDNYRIVIEPPPVK